jgi:hypothetical protein
MEFAKLIVSSQQVTEVVMKAGSIDEGDKG